jgi:hypothetical protein
MEKADIALYQYEPLSDLDGVRLLAILPGKDTERINCMIYHVSLATAPDYEALSYTWGDNYKSHSIQCENGRLPVTANLHSALQHFRYRDKTRMLWADAVCINQVDSTERSIQVQQMHRIYQQAREVLIWLGEEQESDAEAFEFINQFEELDIKVELDPLNSQENTEFLDLVSPDAVPKKALANFLQRPWFSRIWVVQEVAMAFKATMFCGENTTTWNTMLKMVQLLRDRGIYSYLGPSAISVARISTMALMKEEFKSQGTVEMYMPGVLGATSNFSSTDPRDRIFAMLGLISGPDSDGLRPDYTLSKEEIYTDIAIRSIRTDGAFSILSFGGGLANASLNIPSWVPSWIPDPEVKLIPSYYNTAADTQPETSVSNDLKVLTLSGFEIDTIQYVGQEPIRNQITVTGVGVLEDLIHQAHLELDFFKECAEIASVSNPYPTGEEFEQAYMRLLIGNLNIFDGLDSTVYGSLNDGYQSWRYTQEHFEDIMAEQSNEQDMQTPAHVSRARQLYNRAIDSVASGKRFVRTEKRYLGWANASSQIGDIICIFLGADAPYVLRPDGEDFYKLVGECYIHGIMDGEALADKSLVKRKFNIT